MDYLKASEAISLFLTIPTLILSVTVVILWAPRVIPKIKQGKLNEAQWLMLGVSISFIGATIDNLYWAIPWSLFFIDNPSYKAWFEHGSIGNIFFRQLAGIIAAICHLKGIYANKNGFKGLGFPVLVAHVIGLIYVGLLTIH